METSRTPTPYRAECRSPGKDTRVIELGLFPYLWGLELP